MALVNNIQDSLQQAMPDPQWVPNFIAEVMQYVQINEMQKMLQNEEPATTEDRATPIVQGWYYD